jgi:hypothetical protein
MKEPQMSKQTKSTKQVTLVSKRRAPDRSDAVGDALRIAASKPPNWKRNLVQFVNEYSREQGLLWHLGHAENMSAVSQMQARMRVHIPRDESKLQREVTPGDFEYINGTKLFATTRSEGTKCPNWCLGRATLPLDDKYVVTGMEHPRIILLAEEANRVGDLALTKMDRRKSVSDLSVIARSPIRARERFITNKLNDYARIALLTAEKDEIQGLLTNAMKEISEIKQAQIEYQQHAADDADEMRAQFKKMQEQFDKFALADA